MQLSLFDNATIARKSDPITSQIAASEVQPKISGLRAEFVSRLQKLGVPSTANEIASGNESIRKRAKECVELGLVKEFGIKRCSVTGKLAHCFLVAGEPPSREWRK